MLRHMESEHNRESSYARKCLKKFLCSFRDNTKARKPVNIVPILAAIGIDKNTINAYKRRRRGDIMSSVELLHPANGVPFSSQIHLEKLLGPEFRDAKVMVELQSIFPFWKFLTVPIYLQILTKLVTRQFISLFSTPVPGWEAHQNSSSVRRRSWRA